MNLSGRTLSTFQSCPRRWLLEHTGERLRWRPISLLSACLRGTVLGLSAGKPKESVAKEACTRFRTIAADPGLDILVNPWTLSGDLCAILTNFTEALSRQVLLPVKLGEAVPLSSHFWTPGAFVDETGSLHRWATVERLSDDALARELHSWEVVGDMAMLDAPMTLHLVETGVTRNGRRHSPWTRAYQHPMIAGRIKFQAKGGKKLQGNWQSLWFADAHETPESWVDRMAEDGLDLIHHLDVKQLDVAHRDEVRRQIATEAAAMEALRSTEWRIVPMRRAACDFPVTCPWQFKCYD